MAKSDIPRSATYREVWRVGEFRVLWTAFAVSVVGDQLARVALSVLVFDRTGSAAWTALTYAMTFLPDLAGGALLSGLADRFPRRRVIVMTDAVRALLVAVMAIPGQPIAGLVVLLVFVQLLAAPSLAARNAIMPAVLSGDRYVTGMALLRSTYQLGLIAGFGGGAALVATLDPSIALLVDAATFVVSAALVSVGVRPHRPSAPPGGPPPTWWGGVRGGFGLVIADPRLRTLVGLACVSGFYVVPEGLAVPYAAQIGGGTAAVGWLLAANPAGMVAGMLLLQRLPPERRPGLLGPLAVASCLVLVPVAWAPGLAVSVVLWFGSGMASAYNLITNATFVQLVPDHARGQAVGLASAALRVAQGMGILAAGVLAQALTPSTAIMITAISGTLVAATAALAWHRASPPSDSTVAGLDTEADVDRRDLGGAPG